MSVTSQSSSLVVVSLSSSASAQPIGDANHHAHPRLLGEQRAHGGEALLVGLGAGGLADLRLVRLAEPATLLERVGQDPVELWGRGGDDRLRLAKPLTVRESVDRRIEPA